MERRQTKLENNEALRFTLLSFQFQVQGSKLGARSSNYAVSVHGLLHGSRL
jgi:hypothetical protein